VELIIFQSRVLTILITQFPGNTVGFPKSILRSKKLRHIIKCCGTATCFGTPRNSTTSTTTTTSSSSTAKSKVGQRSSPWKRVLKPKGIHIHLEKNYSRYHESYNNNRSSAANHNNYFNFNNCKAFDFS